MLHYLCFFQFVEVYLKANKILLCFMVFIFCVISATIKASAHRSANASEWGLD